EAVVVGHLAHAGVLDDVVYLGHGRVHRVNGNHVHGHVVAAVGGAISPARLDQQLHLKRGLAGGGKQEKLGVTSSIPWGSSRSAAVRSPELLPSVRRATRNCRCSLGAVVSPAGRDAGSSGTRKRSCFTLSTRSMRFSSIPGTSDGSSGISARRIAVTAAPVSDDMRMRRRLAPRVVPQ